ncbi:MAG: MMPL family transporter [Pseudomonadota bacterium]
MSPRNLRVLVLVVLAVLSAGAALTLRKVTFDFNPQLIYQSDSDAYRFMQEHDRLFGRDDNVVVLLVDGRPADDPEVLTYLRQAAAALGQVPGVVRVDGLPTAAMLAEQDGALAAVQVLPPGPIDDSARERVRQAARDPLLGGVVVASDLSISVLFAVLDTRLYDLKELEPVIDGIEQRIAALAAPAGARAHITGIPFIRVDAVRDLIGDQLRFLPLTALVYLILLAFMFRWVWGVVLPLAAVGVSILWSMAMIVVLGHPINIINNILPTLLFVIGISDSIHLLSRYREELALGRSHHDALSTMFRSLLLACLLTSVTTAVGVGSLVVSETPVLREFGIIAGVGVMLAYVSTMSVIPAVLYFIKPPKVPLKKPGAGDRIDQTLAAAANFMVNRPRRVIAGAAALTLGFGLLSLDLKVDSYLMAVYPEDHPNAQTNVLVEKSFGGVIPMDIVFSSREDQDLRRDADLLRRLSELQRYVEDQPGVGRTLSLVDLLAAIYRAVAVEKLDRDNPRAVPLSDETVAQLLLVAELSGDEVSDQFARFVAQDGRRIRLISRVSDLGARNINAMTARLQAEIDKIFYGRDDLEIRLTGDGVVGSASIDRFVNDLAASVFTAGLIIFATIGFLFRSAKIGFLSILPSATPLLATLAMMSVAGIHLDVTSIVVFAMALGLAVDHAIHILARYREERQLGSGCKAAVVRAYRGSGRAVILAAVLLLLGFLVLMTSNFLPTRRTGLLSAVCVLGALVGVLVLLPALLALFDKGRRAAEAYRSRSA